MIATVATAQESRLDRGPVRNPDRRIFRATLSVLGAGVIVKLAATGKLARRVYCATALGEQALESAKRKVSELFTELFEEVKETK